MLARTARNNDGGHSAAQRSGQGKQHFGASAAPTASLLGPNRESKRGGNQWRRREQRGEEQREGDGGVDFIGHVVINVCKFAALMVRIKIRL